LQFGSFFSAVSVQVGAHVTLIQYQFVEYLNIAAV